MVARAEEVEESGDCRCPRIDAGVPSSIVPLRAMLNVFVSRDDLKAAVAAWIDGKAAAEAKHGSISSWDVSRVNDFSYLF